MKYKYIFFDLDKTLWDYEANSTQSLSQLFEEYQLGIYFSSLKEFLLNYHQTNDQLWDDYRKGQISKELLRHQRFYLTFKEKGLDNRELAIEFGEHYMDITPKLTNLAPHAVEVLEYLQAKGYIMNILTNGFLKTQETKLAHANIDHFFDKIYSSDEFGINKPNKEIFHWAVSSINAKKNACLMIGDDLEVDVLGAQNYGIDAIWYNCDNLPVTNNSITTIFSLSELQRLL